MNRPILDLLAVSLILLTSLGMLITRNWRWMLFELACQYTGVFWLTTIRWPIELAMVKVIAGWTASTILGIAMAGAPAAGSSDSRFWPSGRIFRLLVAALVLMVVFALAPQLESWWPGVPNEPRWGGLMLIFLGVLHLALTAQPLRVAVGLLTALSGFEVLYAAIEASTLVASLLAAINLGIAVAGAYLINAPQMEDFSR